jgi:hypothetical protein
MLSALLAATYNTLLGCVFDYFVNARRTLRGWAFLLGASVLTGSAAYFVPKSIAAVLLVGTIAYIFALRIRNVRDLARVNGKMRGLYALDSQDADILQLAQDMQTLVHALGGMSQEQPAPEAAPPVEDART